MTKSLADLISQVNDLAEEQGLLFTYDIQAAPKPKSPVPDSWEGLGKVGGFWVDDISYVRASNIYDTDSESKNLFSTKELAQAALAIAQLSQLMYRTWDNDEGWRPKELLKKYIITPNYSIYSLTAGYSRLLQFQTKEIAEDFLTKHRALIEQAAPILFGRAAE